MSRARDSRVANLRKKKLSEQDTKEEWQPSKDMLRRTTPLAPWLEGDKSSLPKAPPGRGRAEG